MIPPCFDAKRGLCDQDWILRRTVRLCHTAKGDPHEGHHFHFVKVVGPEMVSLVPPDPRRVIIRKREAFPSFLLRRTAGMRPEADSVRQKVYIPSYSFLAAHSLSAASFRIASFASSVRYHGVCMKPSSRSPEKRDLQ